MHRRLLALWFCELKQRFAGLVFSLSPTLGSRANLFALGHGVESSRWAKADAVFTSLSAGALVAQAKEKWVEPFGSTHRSLVSYYLTSCFLETFMLPMVTVTFWTPEWPTLNLKVLVALLGMTILKVRTP